MCSSASFLYSVKKDYLKKKSGWKHKSLVKIRCFPKSLLVCDVCITQLLYVGISKKKKGGQFQIFQTLKGTDLLN
jgi:hypothetical protein